MMKRKNAVKWMLLGCFVFALIFLNSTFYLKGNLQGRKVQAKTAAAPKSSKILKIKQKESKALTISWKKVKKCTGYELREELTKRKGFVVMADRSVSKKKNSVCIPASQLLGFSKISVKIRTYSQTGKKKIYSAWSEWKSLKLAASSSSSEQGGNAGKYLGIHKRVNAKNEYMNWDGVSNVSQFKDCDGGFSFAYAVKKKIVVVKIKNSAVESKLKLDLVGQDFGAIVRDEKGRYYVASGTANKGTDTTKETILITQYSPEGEKIKTVGDNGESSLEDYYDSGFYTKIPFNAGNCSMAVNGNLVTVNYGREMYNGHQSNSVFTINTETMKKITIPGIYNSHSFAQRAVPYKDGFIYASEGDGYPRAFRISTYCGNEINNFDIFDFWLAKNSSSNMFVVNDNFAHMGDIVSLGENRVAFMAMSAKSLSSAAKKETENLFIQIFDPTKNLEMPEAYYTSGVRQGTAGLSGSKKAVNYGVKWLTSGNEATYTHPQMTSDENGNLYILFEQNGSVYYMVLDMNGNVKKEKTLYANNVQLNPCETPVFADGAVCWVGNAYDDSDKLYLFRIPQSFSE